MYSLDIQAMDTFYQCLRRMKEKCVIQDAEYWGLTLQEGETPNAWECNDRSLRLRTKEGFLLALEFQDEKGFFEVDVALPKDFDHEALSLHGIMEPSSLFYDRIYHRYTWDYHYAYDANFFHPLEKQWKFCHASGPVQIMDTCRAFIQELMAKRHEGPVDTFQKNLRWIQRQCLIKDTLYWNMELEEGEVPVSPGCNDRSLRLCTKEGFIINISLNNNYYSYYLDGYIKLPSSLHLTSWLNKHAKYEALNIYVPFIEIDVPHFKGENKYGWDHANPVFNANLAVPSQKDDKRISGPVQVLDEARQIITAVMMRESEFRMDILREELMMKACHPTRIATWIEQDFNPF